MLFTIVCNNKIIIDSIIRADVNIHDHFRYDDVDYGGGGGGRMGDAGGAGGLNRPLRTPRPVTPQTLMSNDLSSHHETAF